MIAGWIVPEKVLPGNKTADFSAVGFGKEQLGYDGIGVYGIITKMGGLKRIDISQAGRMRDRSMGEVLEESLWRA